MAPTADARGGFASARSFEHVADVVVSVLHDAGQVRVARTRARHGRAVHASGIGRRFRRNVPSCCCQFSQSLFGIRSAMGAPVVRAVTNAAQRLVRDRIRSPCGGRGHNLSAVVAVVR